MGLKASAWRRTSRAIQITGIEQRRQAVAGRPRHGGIEIDRGRHGADAVRRAAGAQQVHGQLFVRRNHQIRAPGERRIKQTAERSGVRAIRKIMRQLVGERVVRMVDDGPFAGRERDRKAFVVVRIHKVDAVIADNPPQGAHEQGIL